LVNTWNGIGVVAVRLMPHEGRRGDGFKGGDFSRFQLLNASCFFFEYNTSYLPRLDCNDLAGALLVEE